MGSMSSRLDKSRMVLASYQPDEANRCVDIFSRPNRTFGFEEFRRAPEDMGAWTQVSCSSVMNTRRRVTHLPCDLLCQFKLTNQDVSLY